MENFRRTLEAYRDCANVNNLFIMIQQAHWAINNAQGYKDVRDVIGDVYGQQVDSHEVEKIKRYFLGLL